MQYGPTIPISEEVDKTKYRLPGETFEGSISRVAGALSDDQNHYNKFRNICLDQRFLPAGRVRQSIGAALQTTAFNCFVESVIEDSMPGIMKVASSAAMTLRMGGGVGYDFSPIRPRHSIIKTLGSTSSGPVSMMGIFDAVCATISSAGHRRGAMMAVLRIDHPDIEEFIRAKRTPGALTNFNISVAVTDDFMDALKKDQPFDLVFNGEVHKTIRAKALWDEIMRSNWDWAEPGVLFVDRINKMNNLQYCETIAATNPCAEQPLPPNGACLLGSFNLTKYLVQDEFGDYQFDGIQFAIDIPHVIRAMDNIIEETTFPNEAQAEEARMKRRMGIGVTGLANALEMMGHPYGSAGFIHQMDWIMQALANGCYRASAKLAAEKGSFPLYNETEILRRPFVQRLAPSTRDLIRECGLRNGTLISIAPTGTISLAADNVSSGIEPVFQHSYNRTIRLHQDEVQVETVKDWAAERGCYGKTVDQVKTHEHLAVMAKAQWWTDSSISKTINLPKDITWEQFVEVYSRAYEFGLKGCTTFNPRGKRSGILVATPKQEEDVEQEGAACYFDPETGAKSCE